jgi:curli biogenesis system outer membrane secretion channel CsgG
LIRIHLALWAVLLGLAGLVSAQDKPTVAVIDFDHGTVQSGVAAMFGTNQDVGKGMADLIVEKLVKSGKWRVIERKAISKILAEQNFSNSDRVDPNSAAKIGRLLGADAIIMGSITQFGRDDKQAKLGADAIGGRLSKYGIGGVGQKKSTAVVGLSGRLVNVNTGEILLVASGKGESSRSGTSLVGGGGSVGAAANAAMDMSSSNFAETLLGEAVHQASTNLVNELSAGVARIPAKQVVINALVADVSGSTLVINNGTKSGLKVGDKLMVKRVGREIRDPATGKVIRRVEENVGELTVTEADEASAVGTFAGTGTVKVGDSVQNR